MYICYIWNIPIPSHLVTTGKMFMAPLVLLILFPHHSLCRGLTEMWYTTNINIGGVLGLIFLPLVRRMSTYPWLQLPNLWYLLQVLHMLSMFAFQSIFVLFLHLLIYLIREIKRRVVQYFLPIGESYDIIVCMSMYWLSSSLENYLDSFIMPSLYPSMSAAMISTIYLHLVDSSHGALTINHIMSGTMIEHPSVRF